MWEFRLGLGFRKNQMQEMKWKLVLHLQGFPKIWDPSLTFPQNKDYDI